MWKGRISEKSVAAAVIVRRGARCWVNHKLKVEGSWQRLAVRKGRFSPRQTVAKQVEKPPDNQSGKWDTGDAAGQLGWPQLFGQLGRVVQRYEGTEAPELLVKFQEKGILHANKHREAT